MKNTESKRLHFKTHVFASGSRWQCRHRGLHKKKWGKHAKKGKERTRSEYQDPVSNPAGVRNGGIGPSIVRSDDAVADAPLEVGLRVGLDEGVDGSDDAVLVTGGVQAGGSSQSIAANADRRGACRTQADVRDHPT